MAKYIDLCVSLDRTGRFMSNAIGMCQRELRAVRGGEKSRIDRYLVESATYGAFQQGRDLGAEFVLERSKPGFLVWTHDLKTSKKFPPFPVRVDWNSGIVRQEDTKVFGLLEDVRECLFRKDPSTGLTRWSVETETTGDHREAEVSASGAATSNLGTVASNGRRVGQAWYRQQLFSKWGSRCIVSGCQNPDLLRASHIKRWVDSTDQERLDEHNGLLLAAHIDLAFENGLIGFADNGSILLSNKLGQTDRRALGLTGKEAIPNLSPATRRYLAHHRSRHGFVA